MATMDKDYDGWALSLSAGSLQPLLQLLAPPDVRVAAWTKPFAAYKKHVRIAYTWEPVIFRPGRPNNAPDAPVTRDSLTVSMTTMRGVMSRRSSAAGSLTYSATSTATSSKTCSPGPRSWTPC